MGTRSRHLAPALMAALAGGILGCSGEALGPVSAKTSSPALSVATTGNGAPSGAHYNLNIIGMSKEKNVNMDGSGGNTIFVALGTKDASVHTKIMLEQSASAGEFAVLDKNGTDGTASFSLPAPGTYTIWARALAKPGGSATMTTCATDVSGTVVDGDICSTENEVFVRGTGKSSFRNVTTALTTIELDPVAFPDAVTACGGTTVDLFDPCLDGYFWQYDNNGLKLLQLRVYTQS